MPVTYIAGMGLHTALGCNVSANFSGLLLPPQPPAPVDVIFADQCAAVPYRLLADTPLTHQEKRLYHVIEAVVAEAIADAQLTPAECRNMALFIGSSSFDISVSETVYQRDLRTLPHALPLAASSCIGNLATAVRQQFNLRGPDFSFNTACTASANALLYAAALITQGEVQHALVIGVELFNTITAMGFHSLNLLTSGVMKPFDIARDGLALGESCAAVILSANPADSLMHLRGGATLCDTHSISAANPDGSTITKVMTQALQNTALSATDIHALKVHGTASLLNDEAEAAGMRNLFGELPPLCALKPFIGHTLGACGLSELILFCASAAQSQLPATPGICAQPGDLGVVLPQSPQPLAAGNFMLNYFGFGGSNTSLILSNLEH